MASQVDLGILKVRKPPFYGIGLFDFKFIILNFKLKKQLLLALFFTACAPQPVFKALKTYPPQPEYADLVLLLPTDSVDTTPMEKLGEIALKRGQGKNCDYLTVLDSASRVARRWGANVLKIDKHLPPAPILGVPCHRIWATAYRTPSLDSLLNEIPWHENRRLKIADFRADTTERPFLAATSTGIRVFWEYLPDQRIAIVQPQAVVYPKGSYFKLTADSLDVLAHEQGHFDIAEVYARKLRKSISEVSFSAKTWTAAVQKLYDANALEMQTAQDKYDHDIYADPSRQTAWLLRIYTDLKTYHAFKANKVLIQLNK